LSHDNSTSLPINLDGAAYQLPPLPHIYGHLPTIEEAQLPSLDHAIYLFNAFKFHLNQTFRFVDERRFTETLHAFYRHDPDFAPSPLAFAEVMFVLAFGKAFLSRSTSTTTPKGWMYASWGFAALPTLHNDSQDNMLAIQVYCLAALYSQSIDMRVTAFDYVRSLRPEIR